MPYTAPSTSKEERGNWACPANVAHLQASLSLSPRQAMVALLGIGGHSEQAIAELLAISPHTVRHHFKKLYIKLGVSSRMAMTTAVLSVLLSAQTAQSDAERTHE